MMSAKKRSQRSERGFTLIELMVSLVLTGLALALIVSITLTQSRAAVRMESSVRQLEQVRLTADLLSTEIADLPRGFVLYARDDSLSYLLPISWGVLCGELTRADATAKKKKKKPKKGDPLPPEYDPDAALYLEPLPTSMGAPTPEGFGVSLDGVDWSFYPTPNWAALGVVADYKARGACLDSVKVKPPTGKKLALNPPPETYFKFPNYSGITIAQPPEQAVFAAYVMVSYYLKPESDGSKTLYRAISGTNQKLAWPFTPNAGFRYRLADGSELTTVSAADLVKIRSIKATLPAQKLADPRWQSDSLEIAPWMPLYNSR